MIVVFRNGWIALTILAGLLWSGALPATWPVTSAILGLALAFWLVGGVQGGLKAYRASRSRNDD